jgi:hypothetical protein
LLPDPTNPILALSSAIFRSHNMSKKIIRTYRSMLVILPILALLALFPNSGPILPVMGLAAIIVILFNWLES